MEKRQKGLHKKAVWLEQQLHHLQTKIYNFENELYEKGLEDEAINASNSGFELDAAMNEMRKAINRLKP
jgi:hypothetical protein